MVKFTFASAFLILANLFALISAIHPVPSFRITSLETSRVIFSDGNEQEGHRVITIPAHHENVRNSLVTIDPPIALGSPVGSLSTVKGKAGLYISIKIILFLTCTFGYTSSSPPHFASTFRESTSATELGRAPFGAAELAGRIASRRLHPKSASLALFQLEPTARSSLDRTQTRSLVLAFTLSLLAHSPGGFHLLLDGPISSSLLTHVHWLPPNALPLHPSPPSRCTTSTAYSLIGFHPLQLYQTPSDPCFRIPACRDMHKR
ncbi:hypothetical protein F5887DRAFT_924998 [Amanita rubescens]|nr:hypothetical protein F5887DRAFT_924998 [Amanita rubescens]